MAIRWKVVIEQQKEHYSDSLVLRHDSFERVCAFVKYIEDNFATNDIKYHIESEVIDDGKE